MKKIILSIAVLTATAFTIQAQSYHDSDRESNIVSHTLENKDITISAGGRLTLDGAHYINDKTDMSSGVKVGEVRVNLFASFKNKFDLKIDLDFADKKVEFKDIFARWNINKRSSLRIGNFVAPFSMERVKSTSDLHFISHSSPQLALALGRRLSLEYRAYNDLLWGGAALYASNMNKSSLGGDSGWGVSGRFVLNPQINNDLILHVGGGISFRTADANGFDGDDDDYNRNIDYQSSLETVVDNYKFLNANVTHARKEIRYNAELLLAHKRFFIQSEYTGSYVERKRDNQKLFEDQLGGIWSHQTLEAWENWFGSTLGNRNFSGAYVQAGFLILGDGYNYSRYEAVNRPSKTKGSLELVARFSHTNLNAVDGTFFNGKFYESNKGPGVEGANFNYSIGGGIVNSYTVGLNYYVNKHARVMLNYGYSNINNLYLEDTYAHSLQGRIQITF